MKVATLLKSLGLYSLKVNSMFSFYAEGLNLVQVRIGPVGLVLKYNWSQNKILWMVKYHII